MDKLANEEVLLIIYYIAPDDIGAFSSVNRKIHDLSSARLARHRALKDKYNSIRLCTVRNVSEHPLQVLCDIRKDPSIALYVKHLRFACCNENFARSDTSLDTEAWIMIQRKGNVDFSHLINFPIYPHEVGDFMADVNNGTETDWYEILLACLPSLQTLQVIEKYRHKTHLLEISEPYTLLNGGLGPYPGLKTVELYNWEFDHEMAIHNLASFALLPSVRRITSRRIGVHADQDFGPPTWESAISRVECIELEDCQMDEVGFKRLLLPMRNLRVFRYIHNRGLNGISEFDRWVEALAESVGDTLEDLTLSNPSPHGGGSLIKSFKGLKRLCRLEIDSKSFIPRLDDDKEGQNLSPRLVDLMPSSIISIRLLGLTRGRNMLGLLRDFTSKRDKLLPNLDLFMFGAGLDMDQVFEHELQSVGVSVMRQTRYLHAMHWSCARR